MRLLKESVENETDISCFLGVPYIETHKALNELMMLGYVIQVPTPAGYLYKLSNKGIGVLESELLLKTRDETFTIKIDAISGDLYHVDSLNSYPLKNDSGETICSNIAQPSLWDITSKFKDIKELYRQYMAKFKDSKPCELDDILDIINFYTEYRRLRLLVFENNQGGFRFKVFDRQYYAPEYEEPLTEMARMGIDIWQMEEMEQCALLEKNLTDKNEADNVAVKEHKAIKEIITTILPLEIDENQRSVVYPVYPLTTTEHFEKLLESFNEAEQEIIIISPWVAQEVICDIETHMKKFINRGGRLWIGYGYPGNVNHKNAQTEKTIKLLVKILGTKNFYPVKLGDTHEKILICDKKFAIVGSYNWLSFRGDRKRGFVAETSVFIGIPDVVTQIYERVQRRLILKRGKISE